MADPGNGGDDSEASPQRISLLRRLRRIAGVARILDARQRGVHLRVALQRLLGLRRDRLPVTRDGIKNIVFVCHGNVIRSPYSAALFRGHVASSANATAVEVYSAGLLPRAGRHADARAQQIAAEQGIKLDAHRSTTLSREMVSAADLIVVMDAMNEAILLSRFPDAESRVVMLGSFGSGESHYEIDDPYNGNLAMVRACFVRIEKSIGELWAALLRQEQSQV